VKESTGQYLIWARTFKQPKYEMVSCQIEKWQFDRWLGSKFRVGFNRSSAKGNVALCKHDASMFNLTLPAELRQIQELQNEVCKKARIPTREEYVAEWGTDILYGMYHTLPDERCQPVKYSPNKHVDIWLRFVDDADVEIWGKFLADWIPKALHRNEEEDWTKFGWG
jgi:hypothetical protein